MLQCSSRGGVLLGPGGGLPGPGGGWVLLGLGGGLPGPGGGGFSLVGGGSAWSRGGSPWSRGGLPGPGGSAWSGGVSREPPPVNRITDTCKNITLATTSLRPVIKTEFPLGLENLEIWEGIFQLGKNQGKSLKILEKSGNFRQMLLTVYYF